MNRRPLLVWGNCQAPPLARLITEPLARLGVDVVPVPAVYLIDADRLAEVHALLPHCAALVAQPVRDDYRLGGCGTDQLAQLLAPGAPLVTFPVVRDDGAFPYQVHGYDAADARVDAPLTDYHDLRVLHAAARGQGVAETLSGWPQPPVEAVRAVHDASRAELRRRERDLTVPAAHLLEHPDAMWTMTHPSNAVLADLARAVLVALDAPGAVRPPDTELLGQRRAPVDAAVAAALGWPQLPGRDHWRIDGRTVPPDELVDRQLRFYAERPDVVARTLHREQPRSRTLGLR